MHFATAQEGWALASVQILTESEPHYALLRTVDGGHTWTVARRGPPAPAPNPMETPVTVVAAGEPSAQSAVLAAVASSGSGRSVAISSTSNGGDTWRTTTVASPFVVGAMSFGWTTSTAGWMLLTGYPGLTGASTALYRTADGGHTWARLSVFTAIGILPTGAVLDGAVGWLTGQNFSTAMLSSHSGGQSWGAAPLPIPSRVNADTDPAIVARSGAVEVPVVLYLSHGRWGFNLYHRLSAGAWAASTTLQLAPPAGPGVVYAAAGSRRVWVMGAHTLYGTTSAGSSWQRVSRPPRPWSLMDFLSSGEGWAIAAGGRPALSHTTDGGVHWTAMPFTVTR